MERAKAKDVIVYGDLIIEGREHAARSKAAELERWIDGGIATIREREKPDGKGKEWLIGVSVGSRLRITEREIEIPVKKEETTVDGKTAG